MSVDKPVASARSVVEEVLGRVTTREIWSGNFEKALPISVQDFDLSAVLPAVFYMFRFGQRRGKGKFLECFGGLEGTAKVRKKAATIERVAAILSDSDAFEGFKGETEQAILGDLLLSFCLENSKRALGRKEQVQRVSPAHYMASWVDLPDHVAHLRFVPEMTVALLADQEGENVQLNEDGDRTWFSVGRSFEENVLLRAFHQGVTRDGQLASRSADRFDESAEVGLDQLLMIRLAQRLGTAPDKLRGGEGERISNQLPVAERATRNYSEDIRLFVRAYAGVVPRHVFVELLESCMTVGLTSIITSVIEILFAWAATGTVRPRAEQSPAPLFVDCSNGVDRRLKALAEQAMDDFFRRIERIPVVLMALRLLDQGARYDPRMKSLKVSTRPFATEWINLLGDLLMGRRDESLAIRYDLERKTEQLAERLDVEYPEGSEILRSSSSQPNPVWRIAECLTLLQGRENTQRNLIKMFDSALLIGRPNGLAQKRTVFRNIQVGGRRKTDVRSLVFSDPVLDFLVHLHVLRRGANTRVRPIAFQEFLELLQTRYGFYVDSAPPGMTISNDLLRENRLILESRLRDLGVLVGVNDAESMKYLRPRFDLPVEAEHALE